MDWVRGWMELLWGTSGTSEKEQIRESLDRQRRQVPFQQFPRGRRPSGPLPLKPVNEDPILLIIFALLIFAMGSFIPALSLSFAEFLIPSHLLTTTPSTITTTTTITTVTTTATTSTTAAPSTDPNFTFIAIDTADNSILPGVTIEYMYGQVYGSITTDSLGIASIHIETGSLLVAIATKDGFTTVESELEVDLTKSVTLTLPMAYIATTSASTTVTTATEASTTTTKATTTDTITSETTTSETTTAETTTAETTTAETTTAETTTAETTTTETTTAETTTAETTTAETTTAETTTAETTTAETITAETTTAETTTAETTTAETTEADTTTAEITTPETTTTEIITETTTAETTTAEITTPEITTEATTPPPADPNFRFVTLSGADNSVVPGVTIVYTVNGGASQSVTSDSQGQANIYIPDGAEVEATGSIDGYINSANTLVVDLSKSTALTLTLVPSLAETTEFKTVMNWGTEPRDLDLMALQYSGADCTISYRGNCEGVTYDIDNVNGGDNGAETITWSSTSTPFKYIIYVTTYETEPGIFINSQARLTVYGKDGSTISGTIPTTDPNGASMHWVFGCFDGTAGISSFKTLNILIKENPTPDLCA